MAELSEIKIIKGLGSLPTLRLCFGPSHDGKLINRHSITVPVNGLDLSVQLPNIDARYLNPPVYPGEYRPLLRVLLTSHDFWDPPEGSPPEVIAGTVMPHRLWSGWAENRTMRDEFDLSLVTFQQTVNNIFTHKFERASSTGGFQYTRTKTCILTFPQLPWSFLDEPA